MNNTITMNIIKELSLSSTETLVACGPDGIHNHYYVAVVRHPINGRRKIVAAERCDDEMEATKVYHKRGVFNGQKAFDLVISNNAC